MPYLDEVYSALTAVMLSTWPDLSADSVFQSEHIDLFPISDMTPPYGIVNIESTPTSEDGPVNGWSYLIPCEVVYVAAVDGPVSGIRAKLEAYRDALQTGVLSAGQVWGTPTLEWGREMDLNRMLADRNLSQRAGKITVPMFIGTVTGG